MTRASERKPRKKKRALRIRKGRARRVRAAAAGSPTARRRAIFQELGVELALDTYAVVAGAVETGLESALNEQPSEKLDGPYRLDLFAALRKSVLRELDRVVRFRRDPEEATPRVNVRAGDLVEAVLEAFRGMRLVREDPRGEKGPPWHQ